MVIDEIQRRPDLFPLLRTLVDRESSHREQALPVLGGQRKSEACVVMSVDEKALEQPSGNSVVVQSVRVPSHLVGEPWKFCTLTDIVQGGRSTDRGLQGTFPAVVLTTPFSSK